MEGLFLGLIGIAIVLVLLKCPPKSNISLVESLEAKAHSAKLAILSPECERLVVFQPFPSIVRPAEKQKLVEKKINEMKTEGWVFLSTRMANPFKTLLYLGGGVNLEFIKNPKNELKDER